MHQPPILPALSWDAFVHTFSALEWTYAPKALPAYCSRIYVSLLEKKDVLKLLKLRLKHRLSNTTDLVATYPLWPAAYLYDVDIFSQVVSVFSGLLRTILRTFLQRISGWDRLRWGQRAFFKGGQMLWPRKIWLAPAEEMAEAWQIVLRAISYMTALIPFGPARCHARERSAQTGAGCVDHALLQRTPGAVSV